MTDFASWTALLRHDAGGLLCFALKLGERGSNGLFELIPAVAMALSELLAQLAFR